MFFDVFRCQVNLSLGRASRSVTPADSADLVIDFEILPPRKATAESIQLFFDRRLEIAEIAAERLGAKVFSSVFFFVWVLMISNWIFVGEGCEGVGRV